MQSPDREPTPNAAPGKLTDDRWPVVGACAKTIQVAASAKAGICKAAISLRRALQPSGREVESQHDQGAMR